MWIKPKENLPEDKTQVIVKLDSPSLTVQKYAVANYFADTGFHPANVQAVAYADGWGDDQVRFIWKVIAWRPVDCLEM